MTPTIRVNGIAAVPAENAAVVRVAEGLFSVLQDGISYEVRMLGGTVTVNGFPLEVEIADPRQWKRSGAAAGSQGRASINSPMPGKVVRILVQVGDEVEAGQGIVVVEAMKMQNELKSPQAGRVAEIRVAENDSVAAGAVLALIESGRE
jgi:biotin carboxyl carrier protein